MQFPDGAMLSVGTVSCDDQIHQAVYLSYTPSGSTTPTMELELPPKTVDVIIRELQEHANQARFVKGARMLEYPVPYPVPASRDPRRGRKMQRNRTKKGQPGAAPGGGPATHSGNSGVTEGPPSAS